MWHLGHRCSERGFCSGGPLAEVSHEDLSRQFEVNVFGLMTTACGGTPPQKSKGRLALIASVASLVYSPGMPTAPQKPLCAVWGLLWPKSS